MDRLHLRDGDHIRIIFSDLQTMSGPEWVPPPRYPCKTVKLYVRHFDQATIHDFNACEKSGLVPLSWSVAIDAVSASFDRATYRV